MKKNLKMSVVDALPEGIHHRLTIINQEMLAHLKNSEHQYIIDALA